MRSPFAILLLSALALATSAQPTFTERSAELGIDHFWGANHLSGDLGGGIAMCDFDRDGDLDLFLGGKSPQPIAVFVQEDGFFEERGSELGLGLTPGAKQILFFDADGDDWLDLFVARWFAQPLLFENREGVFVDRSEASGMQIPVLAESGATGATAGDVDRDGDLDVYLSIWNGPLDPLQRSNHLYRNDGDFVFTDVTDDYGLHDEEWSYQPVFSDLSGDGRLDLVIANDKPGGMNYYEAQADGSLLERSYEAGLLGIDSNTETLIYGMGMTLGDFDNDLRADIYITNFPRGNVLYHNLSGGQFEEVAIPTGTLSERYGWGTNFFDADNDGWLDLYVGNFGATPRDRLYWNQQDGTFEDVATSALAPRLHSFASAVGDLNEDGFLDLVINYSNAPTRVYLNDGGGGHWLSVELLPANAIGAVVEIRAGGMSQRRELRAGDSYLGFASPELEFGLGASTVVEELIIRWPEGTVDSFADVEADARYIARRGNERLQRRGAQEFQRGPAGLIAAPNPASSEVSLVAGQGFAGEGPVTLSIFDLRGRQILRREIPDAPTTWDLRDATGRRVGSGVYMVRMERGGSSVRARVLVLGD